MNKMLEEFEQWAVSTRDQFGLPFFTIKNESGKYVDHGTEISWQAWKASRAALVVQLKQSSRVGDSDYGRGLVDGSAIYKIYAEGQLDNAGIKWTE